MVVFFLLPKSAFAALTEVSVRIDRMKTNTATGGQVCAKSTGTGTESSVTVTFPGTGTQGASSFGVNSTSSNWSTTTTNLPNGATGWIGIGATASGVSGAAVTFASGNMVQNTLYCFNFASASTLTTPTNTNVNLSGSVNTDVESATYWSTATITNDQVVVTATVPPTFSFSISDVTTLALGTLSTSSVTTSAGRTLNIGTNAIGGWIAWVMSDNGALTSSITGQSIASPGTSNNTPDSLAAQEGYVLGVAITTDGAGTGTVSQAANFGQEFADSSNTGGHLDADIYTPIAASSGTTDGDVLTFYVKAKIAALRAPATDYTDTLTFVASGRF